MLELVKKQASYGRKRLLAAVGALLLGAAVTIWTAAADILPANGPWRPMDNPDAYRISESVRDGSRNVYLRLEELLLYGTGYEVGEGDGALVLCLASRDGVWFPVLTDISVYDQMDWYGMAEGWAGDFRRVKSARLEANILSVIQESFGFMEEEILPFALEPAPPRLLWLEDGLLLLIGLALELLGLWILLGKADLQFSPAWRGLAVYGKPEALAEALEKELSACPYSWPLFTQNWMIIRRGWSGTVFVPFGDVVWAHMAAHARAGGLRYSVVLYLRSRSRPLVWEVPGEMQASMILARFHDRYPPMDTRYFPQWEHLWKKNRAAFLQAPPCIRL